MRPRSRFFLDSLLGDLGAMVVAMAVASQMVFDTPFPWSAHLDPGQNPRPMVGLLVVGVLTGSWLSMRTVDPQIMRPNFGRAFTTVVFVGITVAVGSFVLRTYWSRPFILVTLAGWLALALVYRAIRIRSPWIDDMVVVTDEPELAKDIADSPHANVLAVLDPRGEPPPDSLPSNTVLVLDLRSVLSDSMASFVSSTTLAGYEVRAFSQVYEEHTMRIPLMHLAEGWEISVPLERRALYAPFKRLFEVLLTLITAPLWLTIGVVTYLVIRVDSPGPGIFKQQRTGLDDQPFTMYKFRTMVVGADAQGPQFTVVDDPRITRVGKFLRATRVDEIPQLWNVLVGDLALVGPRAEQVAFTDQFEKVIPFYRYRHLVRPGVTGWAQVHYGYADDLADTVEKLTYDLYYVRHMAPWLDLQVLAKSAWTVVSGKGAQ